MQLDGKVAYATITDVLTYPGSMVAVCCPQSKTPSSSSALTLLIGQQEEHLDSKQSGYSAVKTAPEPTML